MSNLLLLKNEGDINKARIEAISKVLESEKTFEYTSELISLIYEKFGAMEIEEDDAFAYQNFVRALMEASFWLEIITPNDDESCKSNN